MKTRKTALAFILMTVLVITANAQQYDPESDFKFDWDPNVKDGVAITKYIGTKKRSPYSSKHTKLPGYQHWGWGFCLQQEHYPCNYTKKCYYCMK